jgi:hypothetical protein
MEESMNELAPEAPPQKQSGNFWLYAVAFFLVGAIVGDLVGGGDWDPRTNTDKKILAVLAAQQAAWNRGDLDGFMATYWNSPSLAFCSGTEMTYGWQATRDRYARRYQADGKEMGALTFSEVAVIHADETDSSVRGRFGLKFKDGKTSSGRFTIVLRRIGGEWRIVYDHTAADPNPSQ